MKRTVIALSILLAGITLSAQTIGTENLYQKYRGEKGVVSFTIPGFLMKFAANIADVGEAEEELLRSVRSMRILTIEDESRFPGVNFVKESRMKPGKNGYETLVMVSEGGEDVMILGRMKRDKLKDLLIIVGGEDNVLVHIRGRLNADMIGSIANIADLDDLNFTSQL